jgi:hypothetical protein
MTSTKHRLRGLVVRVPGYRFRSLGLDSRRYNISRVVVGLERGPLRLVSISEKLLERKCSESGLEKPKLTVVFGRLR